MESENHKYNWLECNLEINISFMQQYNNFIFMDHFCPKLKFSALAPLQYDAVVEIKILTVVKVFSNENFNNSNDAKTYVQACVYVSTLTLQADT